MTDARASAACPHCGAAPCLPLVRKLTLFAGMRARCAACGGAVKPNATQACLAFLPAVLFVLAEFVLRPHNFALVMVFVPVCIVWFFIWSVFGVRLLKAGPG